MQYKLRVLDTDSMPVESVLIFTKNQEGQWITNGNGQAVVAVGMRDSLVFQHISFEGLVLSISDIQDRDGQVVLVPKPFFLDELVLVGRTNERREHYLHEVATIEREALMANQPATTADALEKSGAVYVQRSQLGGGSPIMRGFEANRILLVVDGIRMNNLIYRSGHLQNSITVGAVGIEQMELIHGPGSLLYGSDALGGVVHFRSRTPKWKRHDRKTWSGEGMIRYGTANQEKTAGGSVEWRSRRIASISSFSFSNFGDLRMGGNRSEAYSDDHGKRFFSVERIGGRDSLVANPEPEVQLGSGYSQWDFFHKTRMQLGSESLFQLNLQLSGSTDIPRYDQLNDPTRPDTMPRYAEWSYGPQRRRLAALEWHNWAETALYDRFFVILSGQWIRESRVNRFFGSDNRITEAERVGILGLSGDFEKQLNDRRELILKYGFEGIYNGLESEAFRRSLDSAELSYDVLTRYPSGGASMRQLGVYGILSGRVSQTELRYEAGLRYSTIRTKFRYEEGGAIEWPDSYIEGLSATRHAVTGSAALQLPYTGFLRQRFVVGSAFRAPNIDDMAKIRLKADEAQIPNTELNPEYTWQAETSLEATIERNRTRFRATATIFYTHLRDAIVQAPLALLNGSTTIQVDGQAFHTVGNINAESGHIYGAGLRMDAQARNWGASFSSQYTRGRSQTDNGSQPLAHIPPIYGLASFWYQVPVVKWRVSLPFNLAKRLEDYAPDSSDNLEYATADGTPAWFTVNLYTELSISPQLTAYLAVENILDRYYRSFASGISAPGRHIAVSLHAKF